MMLVPKSSMNQHFSKDNAMFHETDIPPSLAMEIQKLTTVQLSIKAMTSVEGIR